MSAPVTCQGCGSTDFRYVPSAPNENGWRCQGCQVRPGEPPGYCPQLDGQDTSGKVTDLFFHLTGELGHLPLLSISNGSECDYVIGRVVGECREAGMYDQEFIIVRLFAAADARGTHSEFWKKIGDGVRAGDDPRDRCDCGELATSWRSTGDKQCNACSRKDGP